MVQLLRGEGTCGREGGSGMQRTWVMGEGTCLVCHASREGAIQTMVAG